MKIVITGAGGLLGQYLNEELGEAHSILPLYHSLPGNTVKYNGIRININDTEELERVLTEFHPEVVVHTAAISTPASADTIPSELVYKTNVQATAEIARICTALKAKLIYTSTDLVYAGYRGSLLTETAKLVPASLYAETKLLGERKVLKFCENYIILRTALMYGIPKGHTGTFFYEMLRNLRNGNKVNLFTDQYRSPLSLADAAKIISGLLIPEIRNEIINFGGPERISRYDFGKLTCKIFGMDESLLNPITMEQVPQVIPVADVSMDISKLQKLGLAPSPLEEAIAFYKNFF